MRPSDLAHNIRRAEARKAGKVAAALQAMIEVGRWESEGGRGDFYFGEGTMAILVNNEGEFYAGFNADRCAPIWRRSKASAVEIGHDILRAVTRQLKALGHPVDVYTVKARGKKAAKENRRAR